MADFVTYITKNGDRWDSIAWAAYGDITKQKDLMDANPDIALLPSFGDGITLQLPIIPEVNTQSSLLPPWKQGSDLGAIDDIVFLTTPSSAPTAKKASSGGIVFGPDVQFDYDLDLLFEDDGDFDYDFDLDV